MYHLDEELLHRAREVLSGRDDLHWIIGGAGSGKSAVARAISEARGVPLYDMDQHIYDRYQSRYRADRHPASSAWFTAPNPLAWVLSLSLDEFDALNRAADAEYLDLLAEDLAGDGRAGPLLFDGGFTHPSVLARVAAPGRIVCLDVADADRVRMWENSAERAEMKRWVHDLPDPAAMWTKFLAFDQLISDTLVAESHAHGIQVLHRDDYPSVTELAQATAAHLGI
jgi:hypothetical protein